MEHPSIASEALLHVIDQPYVEDISYFRTDSYLLLIRHEPLPSSNDHNINESFLFSTGDRTCSEEGSGGKEGRTSREEEKEERRRNHFVHRIAVVPFHKRTDFIDTNSTQVKIRPTRPYRENNKNNNNHHHQDNNNNEEKTFTTTEMESILQSVEAHHQQNPNPLKGHRHRQKVNGKLKAILGAVRFLKGYYLVGVTQRKRVCEIGKVHFIYKIQRIELIPLFDEEEKEYHTYREESNNTSNNNNNNNNSFVSTLSSLARRVKETLSAKTSKDEQYYKTLFISLFHENKGDDHRTDEGQGSSNNKKEKEKEEGDTARESPDHFSSFYYAFTYDITDTLQNNILFADNESVLHPPFQQGSRINRNREGKPSRKRFSWNDFLLEPFSEAYDPTPPSNDDGDDGGFHRHRMQVDWSNAEVQWLAPYLMRGCVMQREVAVTDGPASLLPTGPQTLSLVLMARMGSRYVGSRYYCRGLNCCGDAANEVETEQIVAVRDPPLPSFMEDTTQDDTGHLLRHSRHTIQQKEKVLRSYYATTLSSYVQLRGSVPVQWYHPYPSSATTTTTAVSLNEGERNPLPPQSNDADLSRLLRASYSNYYTLPKPPIKLNVTLPLRQKGAAPLLSSPLGSPTPSSSSLCTYQNNYTFNRTVLHFRSLLSEYGGPIVLLNLLNNNNNNNNSNRDSSSAERVFSFPFSSSEKVKRETPLSDSFKQSVQILNDIYRHEMDHSNSNSPSPSPQLLLHYKEINFKVLKEDSLNLLQSELESIHNEIPFFLCQARHSNRKKVTAPMSKDPHEAKATRGYFEVTQLQTGVVRSNCLDCIDRTNAGQQLIGNFVLKYQIQALLSSFLNSPPSEEEEEEGCTDSASIWNSPLPPFLYRRSVEKEIPLLHHAVDYLLCGRDRLPPFTEKKSTKDIPTLLREMYTVVGDVIALHYGGSETVSVSGLMQRQNHPSNTERIHQTTADTSLMEKQSESVHERIHHTTTPSTTTTTTDLLSWDNKMNVKRFYQNLLFDKTKQESLHLFLGLVQPSLIYDYQRRRLQSEANTNTDNSTLFRVASPSWKPFPLLTNVQEVEQVYYQHPLTSSFSFIPPLCDLTRWWEAPLKTYRENRLQSSVYGLKRKIPLYQNKTHEEDDVSSHHYYLNASPLADTTEYLARAYYYMERLTHCTQIAKGYHHRSALTALKEASLIHTGNAYTHSLLYWIDYYEWCQLKNANCGNNNYYYNNNKDDGDSVVYKIEPIEGGWSFPCSSSQFFIRVFLLGLLTSFEKEHLLRHFNRHDEDNNNNSVDCFYEKTLPALKYSNYLSEKCVQDRLYLRKSTDKDSSNNDDNNNGAQSSSTLSSTQNQMEQDEASLFTSYASLYYYNNNNNNNSVVGQERWKSPPCIDNKDYFFYLYKKESQWERSMEAFNMFLWAENGKKRSDDIISVYESLIRDYVEQFNRSHSTNREENSEAYKTVSTTPLNWSFEFLVQYIIPNVFIRYTPREKDTKRNLLIPKSHDIFSFLEAEHIDSVSSFLQCRVERYTPRHSSPSTLQLFIRALEQLQNSSQPEVKQTEKENTAFPYPYDATTVSSPSSLFLDLRHLYMTIRDVKKEWEVEENPSSLPSSSFLNYPYTAVGEPLESMSFPFLLSWLRRMMGDWTTTPPSYYDSPSPHKGEKGNKRRRPYFIESIHWKQHLLRYDIETTVDSFDFSSSSSSKVSDYRRNKNYSTFNPSQKVILNSFSLRDLVIYLNKYYLFDSPERNVMEETSPKRAGKEKEEEVVWMTRRYELCYQVVQFLIRYLLIIPVRDTCPTPLHQHQHPHAHGWTALLSNQTILFRFTLHHYYSNLLTFSLFYEKQHYGRMHPSHNHNRKGESENVSIHRLAYHFCETALTEFNEITFLYQTHAMWVERMQTTVKTLLCQFVLPLETALSGEIDTLHGLLPPMHLLRKGKRNNSSNNDTPNVDSYFGALMFWANVFNGLFVFNYFQHVLLSLPFFKGETISENNGNSNWDSHSFIFQEFSKTSFFTRKLLTIKTNNRSGDSSSNNNQSVSLSLFDIKYNLMGGNQHQHPTITSFDPDGEDSHNNNNNSKTFTSLTPCEEVYLSFFVLEYLPDYEEGPNQSHHHQHHQQYCNRLFHPLHQMFSRHNRGYASGNGNAKHNKEGREEGRKSEFALVMEELEMELAEWQAMEASLFVDDGIDSVYPPSDINNENKFSDQWKCLFYDDFFTFAASRVSFFLMDAYIPIRRSTDWDRVHASLREEEKEETDPLSSTGVRCNERGDLIPFSCEDHTSYLLSPSSSPSPLDPPLPQRDKEEEHKQKVKKTRRLHRNKKENLVGRKEGGATLLNSLIDRFQSFFTSLLPDEERGKINRKDRPETNNRFHFCEPLLYPTKAVVPQNEKSTFLDVFFSKEEQYFRFLENEVERAAESIKTPHPKLFTNTNTNNNNNSKDNKESKRDVWNLLLPEEVKELCEGVHLWLPRPLLQPSPSSSSSMTVLEQLLNHLHCSRCSAERAQQSWMAIRRQWEQMTVFEG